MKERLSVSAWGLGVRALHLGKRTGLSGPFESALFAVASRLFRPPHEEVEVTLPFGMKMIVPPGFSRRRTYQVGLYEFEVTGLVQSVVKEGMAIVDVGAFCGYYTLLTSHLVGASGKVYSFEPEPRNYGYLQRNMEANSCRNVVAVNQAVSNRNGDQSLAFHKEADQHWLLDASADIDRVTVPATTLDDFFAQQGQPPIDLVKMDIEGGEKAALEGMRTLSARNPNLQLIMEFSLANMRRSGETPEALSAILQELGFHEGYIIERGMKPFSVARSFPRTHATLDLLLKKEASRDVKHETRSL